MAHLLPPALHQGPTLSSAGAPPCPAPPGPLQLRLRFGSSFPLGMALTSSGPKLGQKHLKWWPPGKGVPLWGSIPAAPSSWPAHLRPMCVSPGQGFGFLVLWLPNPHLAERKWWVRPAAWRVAGGSGEERKIHGPSNGACVLEAAPAIRVEINHRLKRKMKDAGMQGPVLGDGTC